VKPLLFSLILFLFYFSPKNMKQTIFTQSIQKFFTDTNGTILDKNTIPVILRKDYPAVLFGGFDYDNAYAKSIDTTFLTNFSSPYIGSFVYGQFIPFLFTALNNNIKDMLTGGDLIHLFCDNIDNPDNYIWIIHKCPRTSPLSILQSFDGCSTLLEFNYAVDNVTQYRNSLKLNQFDRVGNFLSDSIDTIASRTPNQRLDLFTRIKLAKKLDRFFGISFLIDFSCDRINFEFTIQTN